MLLVPFKTIAVLHSDAFSAFGPLILPPPNIRGLDYKYFMLTPASYLLQCEQYTPLSQGESLETPYLTLLAEFICEIQLEYPLKV